MLGLGRFGAEHFHEAVDLCAHGRAGRFAHEAHGACDARPGRNRQSQQHWCQVSTHLSPPCRFLLHAAKPASQPAIGSQLRHNDARRVAGPVASRHRLVKSARLGPLIRNLPAPLRLALTWMAEPDRVNFGRTA